MMLEDPIRSTRPTGRILILNGAPRSGKSTLARAIQAHVSGNWLNLGVDHANATLPPHLLPGIGLRPGGERPDLEPLVLRLYEALFSSILAHASSGFDVVADLGLHDDYSRPLHVFALAARLLGPKDALIIGIDCDIEEIMRRRNADPQGGLYLGGDTAPAPVARWQEAIHAGKTYDLRLDTATQAADISAKSVVSLLAAPPAEPALKSHLRHIS